MVIMFRVKYILAVAVVASLIGCDATKKASCGSAASNKSCCSSAKKHACGPKDTAAAVTAETYGMVVSFYSPGNGIDHKTNEAFVEFVKEKYPQINLQGHRWGREGEVDYCINLNELSTDEQSTFIKEAKELLSASKKVHIYENSTCKHKK